MLAPIGVRFVADLLCTARAWPTAATVSYRHPLLVLVCKVFLALMRRYALPS